MAFRARDIWEDNNGNIMLALCFGIVAFGCFGIYWSQVTRVKPFRARFPMPFLHDGADPHESTLRVKCDGLQNEYSICQIAVYQGEVGFNDPESAVMLIARKGVKGVAVWEVNGLPKGKFAVVAFEDRNENGILDRGPSGAPIERFGVSNNPSVEIFPTFQDAAIEIDGEANIEIHLQEVK